jgi:hypothetical protein
METQPDDREPHEPGEKSGLERHLAVFVEDSTLWPVLLAGVLIFATGGAALLLLALGDRNPFAIAALLILLWMSVDIPVRRRRFGRIGGLLVLLWVASGLAALGFLSLGLF